MSEEIPEEARNAAALGEGVDVEAVTDSGPLMSDAFDEGAHEGEGGTHA